MSDIKEILREYEIKRDNALKRVLAKQKEVYKLIPRISEIDMQLNMVGVKLSKAVLSQYEENILTELQSQTAALIEEKTKLLVDFGFPPDYLTIRYKCKYCQDTGYIESERCSCFNRKQIARATENSSLRDVIKYENFSTFNLEYYSDAPYQNEAKSPRERMREIFSFCLRFANEFDEQFINIYMYGKPGLGKTFLCHSIAKILLDSGKTIYYTSAFQLFKTFEDYRFNKSKENSAAVIDTLVNCDLLIIDDLGTEFSTVLSSSELFNIINTRFIKKRKTIISTNLSPSELVNYYSDRIVSRIQGNYTVLKFYGDDIRIKKKYNLNKDKL